MMETEVEKYDQQISDFLKGKMTPEAKAAFIAEMKINKELRDRAKATCYLVKGLQKEGQQQDDKVIDSVSNNNKITPIYSWLRIAASVIVIFALGITGYRYHQGSLVSELGDKYIVTYEDQYVRGEGNDNLTNELKSISQDVKTGDNLNQHISRLEKLYADATSSSGEDNDAFMYKSEISKLWVISLLKNKDKDEALKAINKIIQDDPESTDAEWARKVKTDIESL